MRRFLILAALAVSAMVVHGPIGVAQGQQAPALPSDINAVTLSRFAPVTPADLDDVGQKALAARPARGIPGPGPGAAGGEGDSPTHAFTPRPTSPTQSGAGRRSS